MLKSALAVCLICVLAAFTLHGETQPALIPWPKEFHAEAGEMSLSDSAHIAVSNESLLPLAKIFAGEILQATGVKLTVVTSAPQVGDIHLSIDPALKDEAYQLKVEGTAAVSGADYNAVAMGTVTLLQAMKQQAGKVSVPHCTISDQSKFSYTGCMLDVARKPYSIATLKACVEAARFYKIRFLQLHMSDENAWTFPSTAFPTLGSTNNAWAGGEKPPVYNLQELKDLVAYGDARGVTFVPEFETPGHSGALCSSLPDIFGYKDADGKQLPVGVINAATEKAYQAIDTLVGEFADVFKSSPYIHMGCDESGFGGTEKFPEVLDLVAREKLPNPEAIFSYYVTRADGIVKKHGKQMIVWQGAATEPIVPPKDIIFMPWVGGNGYAADALQKGYRIINAPWGTKKLYMDVYDCNGFEVPKDEKKLIGATAILWQATEDKALPYMRYNASLRNEPTWNPDAEKDFEDFIARQADTNVLLDKLIHGFTLNMDGALSPLVFDRIDFPIFTDSMKLTLSTNFKSGSLHYTLDGTEPTEKSTQYNGPIVLKDSAIVKAVWVGAAGDTFLYPYTREFKKVGRIEHDAIGATVTYTPDPGYPGSGPKSLVDGILAPGDDYTDPGWVGWTAAPVTINIDLKTSKEIKTISPRSVRSGGGLEPPAKIEYQLSEDGKEFHTVATVERAEAVKHRGWYTATLKTPEKARYIRLLATQSGDWIFIDEIVVNGKLPGPNFVHAAIGKKVTLATPPMDPYVWGGIESLTDGYLTPTASFAQLEWLGWEGKNIDATIDMEKETELHEVGGFFLQHVWGGVRPPTVLTITVSDDGKTFRPAGKVETPQDQTDMKISRISTDLKGIKARYVKFVANTNGQWLFTDELYVNPEK